MAHVSTAIDVRARRPPKPRVDPWRPHGWHLEEERQPDGSVVPDLTIFLTGRECPWTCVFCDLWRFTTDEPTPEGAIPHQLRLAIDEAGFIEPNRVAAGPNRVAAGLCPRGEATAHLKLYNASNYFDAKAVPECDDEAVARLAAPFARIIVESHPKLVGDRAFRFADLLDGQLEVAMGLETIHPEAQPRMGKGATLDDYVRAARALTERGIDWRAFVLVGAPWVPPEEDTEWVTRTVVFAAEHGARHISLIPVRGGNGTLEALQAVGAWEPPTLEGLEDAVDRGMALGTGAVIAADPWDLDGMAGSCRACRPLRRDRLNRLARSGVSLPRVSIRCHCR